MKHLLLFSELKTVVLLNNEQKVHKNSIYLRYFLFHYKCLYCHFWQICVLNCVLAEQDKNGSLWQMQLFIALGMSEMHKINCKPDWMQSDQMPYSCFSQEEQIEAVGGTAYLSGF